MWSSYQVSSPVIIGFQSLLLASASSRLVEASCLMVFPFLSSNLFLKAFTLDAATTDSGRLFNTDMNLSEKKLPRTSNRDRIFMSFLLCPLVLLSKFIGKLGLPACVIDFGDILEDVDHIFPASAMF